MERARSAIRRGRGVVNFDQIYPENVRGSRRAAG